MDPIQKRKQLVLSAALGILHNLSKVPENKPDYRDPDRNALKWLDIYRGSPDEGRRISSLLILCYIIDPETESDLVHDTEGVVDIMMTKLEERLQEQTNEFSIHELVEGLEKLSVNPTNKAKVVSQSLGNIQTVLLTGSDKESNYARNALHTLGYDVEECEPEVSSDVEEDASDKADSKKTTDAIEFVRNMLCVLEGMDSFETDEASQIITAIATNGCNGLTRDEREVVVDAVLENNIAGLLTKIVTDLIKDRELVYKDQDMFATLYSVLGMMWNYSDASLPFSHALGKESAVKMMFDICESYYMDRHEELLQLVGNEKPEESDKNTTTSTELPLELKEVPVKQPDENVSLHRLSTGYSLGTFMAETW